MRGFSHDWTSLCFDPIINEHDVLSSIMNHKSNVVANRVFALKQKSAALPPPEILPRYSQFKLTGSVHAGEFLVFVWTVNMDPFCILYNAKSEAFTKKAKLHVPVQRGPSYPLYCPMVDQLSIADDEDSLLALEGFVANHG
ncbi:hypothetical protein CRG98_014295 [Punica granatum]|uniref:Uncharacterized protein n=1 Tax=Punica granatum TaxID=22663 RepID=A0A2I0K9X1_PUNGR|nr:hypothetical protein CRG98_014295 [Punica granatum]